MTSAAVRSRVLKASDVHALRRDEEQERRALLVAESTRQDMLAEAYAAGFDAGRAQAVADGADAAVRGAAALEELVGHARRLHAEEVSMASRAALAAAMDVAEWVLRHELSTSSRSLLARLEAGAQSLLPSPTTRVLVSPADADAVRGWATRKNGVQVVVDETLQPGNAGVETDAGSVDVTIAAALRIAAETLGVDPSLEVR
ncbi:MAG: Flagellar assembly protein FliH [Frankiales bacterium]|nr:Flagellar assembly protein FliH [Frankiales bacterium]